jgi:hypothetical protein
MSGGSLEFVHVLSHWSVHVGHEFPGFIDADPAHLFMVVWIA